MKRIFTFALFISLVISVANAASSPVALYSKWQQYDTSKLMEMGKGFDVRNVGDSALVCYTVVTDRLREKGKSFEDKMTLSRALNNMGFVYATYFADYPKALALFQEALKVSTESGYDKNLSYVNLNIGGIYLGCNMMYGNHLFTDEVWKYLDKALESGLKCQQYDVAVVACLNMAQMYFDDHRTDKMLKGLQRFSTASIPENFQLKRFGETYCNALKSFTQKDYSRSIAQFKQAIALIPKDDFNAGRYELVVLLGITEAYRAEGNLDDAIATGNELLVKARECESFDTETYVYRLLSQLYAQNKQNDKATEYLLQFHHKKDSTLSERDVTQLSKMPLVNELEDVKTQLAEEYAHRRTIIIVAIIATVFILLLSLYLITVIRSRRKLRSYAKELYRKNVELIKSEQRAREMRQETPIVSTEKYSSSNLSTAESRDIADAILKVMEDTDLITNPDFSLKDLADQTSYPTKTLSQVVNETLGKNFRTLVNEYRIKEACKRLLDTEQYGQYTVEHIAESVGFNSRSNFSVMFKKITGLTPIQFQKNALDDKE